MIFSNTYVLLTGIIFLAILSYKKDALTFQGAIASVFVAGVISLSVSIYGLILLASFFISSTVLGRMVMKGFQKEEFEEKGEKRDAKQVLANGGWAAVASFLFYLTGDEGWIVAFIASLAAANSDTWASTLGKRSQKQPTLLFTKKIVPTGQSGGTTRLGNTGAMLGSLLVVAVAIVFQPVDVGIYFPTYVWILIAFIGVLAQWIDAIVGAFFQALYACDVCKTTTEKETHCNSQTTLIKGSSMINNDVVNHICTVSAMIMGVIVGFIIH